jgi:alpha-glucosidase
MKKSSVFLFAAVSLLLFSCSGKKADIKILSPDGKTEVSVSGEQLDGNHQVIFSVAAGNRKILLPSSFELASPDLHLEGNYELIRTESSEIRNNWVNEFGAIKNVPDNYNITKFFLRNGTIKVNFYCRVYNEGVAFAYEFPEQDELDSLMITDEKFTFRFPGDYTAWSAARAQAQYSKRNVSNIEKECERPLVIEYDSSLTIALAEAALVDYARMKFDPVTGDGYSIRSRLDGNVRKQLPFRSPWRIIMIGKNPGDLLEKNYLLLNLNDPSAIRDISWIKPGKVIREVTLTTTGAKSLVDFIAAHKMQYIEFDAGWYGYEYNDSSDARSVNVDPKRSKGPLEFQDVISYAHSKNVGVLLYVNRRALERQIDEILPIYSRWGILGIKFGFVQVGTQPVTSWMHEAIKKAAEYKMIVDVHDEYRPTGFSRTYPNFLTQEGIRGDEESPSNGHTLITMFTRCIAGAADNTVCYYDNRVDAKMGSHASQMAKAVCIFSPLQFLYWYDRTVPAGKENELAGKPNYLGNEPELEFFDNLPTVWDETKVLSGIIGEYGVIARRKGEEWYIGGINGEKPRDAKIGFNFLTEGRRYIATIYSDDLSVNTRTHVMTESREVNHGSVYSSTIGANRGFAIRIIPAGE